MAPENSDGWKWEKLSDISEKITDGEHLKPKSVDFGIPFLSAKDVRDGEIDFSSPQYISVEDAQRFLIRCNPEKDDILIVSRGACSGRLTEEWREKKNLFYEQWQELSINDILNEPMINGRSVTTAEEGFPVLRLTSVRKGKIDIRERKFGNWIQFDPYRFLIEKDDFFVVRGNGSLSLVGRGGVVDVKPDPIAFPDTLIRLRLKPDLINVYWLSNIWDSKEVRKQIEQLAHTTAGIFKISQKDISQIFLKIPTIQEQKEIVHRINTLFAHADRIDVQMAAAREKVDTITQSILHQAFTGRLVPTEGESD